LALTEAADLDALMRDQPKTFLAYHFHGDIVKAVPDGVNLASSEMTEWQLFRYGLNVYGFQYHAEADQRLIETMCRNNSEYMAANGANAEVVIDQSRANVPKYGDRCVQVLNRWVDLCCS
jgi:GMP synthase (glutamine-hydrolysing)